jgi:signal recognition particle receptor subunit beta
MEEGILGIEDKIEKIDMLVKENIQNKSRHKSIQEIWDIMKRPNLKIIQIKEVEKTQVKDTEHQIDWTRK